MNVLSLISRSFLLLAAFPVLFPLSADAQRVGQRGPVNMVDPVAQALEHRDKLGLSADQLATLDRFRADAEARTAEARIRVEAWRAGMEARQEARQEARRDARREAMREEPRGERQQESLTPDPELRDAMRLLQEEHRSARELLNATLTVDQMRRLQAEVRAELRGDRADVARMAPRGMAPRGERQMRAPGVRAPTRTPARFEGAAMRLQTTPAFRAGFMAGFSSAQRPAVQRRQARAVRDARMPRFERR